MTPRPQNIEDAPEFEVAVQATGEKLTVAKSLSEPFGLKTLLVHQEVLPPGHRASGFHFHTAKEEVFYVLQGHPSVWVGEAFLDLAPGDFIGFGPSPESPHMLVNRSGEPAVVLTVGTDPPDDEITYLEGPAPERWRGTRTPRE